MTSPPRSTSRADRGAASVTAGSRPGAGATGMAAWLVPGLGHFLQGQVQKAVVFAVTLLFMFVIGLAFGGRLFAFQASDPLVFLAAASEWAVLLPRGIAALFGLGGGDVVAATYEYGNAFLIASGLLNMLVTLDAMDLASGRRLR